MNNDTMKDIHQRCKRPRSSRKAPSESNTAEEREHMSRAEAVQILMQLQAIEARCGHGIVNDALEMAISYIVKRHRDICRNKAKRRAAKTAAQEGKI